jgi:hypothetical protein
LVSADLGRVDREWSGEQMSGQLEAHSANLAARLHRAEVVVFA